MLRKDGTVLRSVGSPESFKRSSGFAGGAALARRCCIPLKETCVERRRPFLVNGRVTPGGNGPSMLTEAVLRQLSSSSSGGSSAGATVTTSGISSPLAEGFREATDLLLLKREAALCRVAGAAVSQLSSAGGRRRQQNNSSCRLLSVGTEGLSRRLERARDCGQLTDASFELLQQLLPGSRQSEMVEMLEGRQATMTDNGLLGQLIGSYSMGEDDHDLDDASSSSTEPSASEIRLRRSWKARQPASPLEPPLHEGSASPGIRRQLRALKPGPDLNAPGVVEAFLRQLPSRSKGTGTAARRRAVLLRLLAQVTTVSDNNQTTETVAAVDDSPTTLWWEHDLANRRLRNLNSQYPLIPEPPPISKARRAAARELYRRLVRALDQRAPPQDRLLPPQKETTHRPKGVKPAVRRNGRRAAARPATRELPRDCCWLRASRSRQLFGNGTNLFTHYRTTLADLDPDP